MMVDDPVIAPDAVGSNSMAALMVKTRLLGCAPGCEKTDGEQRNYHESQHGILLWVRMRFEVQDANKPATRNTRRTYCTSHDRRRTLRARKRAELQPRSGGAFGNHVLSWQGSLAQIAADAKHVGRCGHHVTTAATAPLLPSSVQTSTLLKVQWLHESAADSPSGTDSPHTWHGSPQPSGSSGQKQKMRLQHIAANATQPLATIATRFFNFLPLASAVADYTTN